MAVSLGGIGAIVACGAGAFLAGLVALQGCSSGDPGLLGSTFSTGGAGGGASDDGGSNGTAPSLTSTANALPGCSVTVDGGGVCGCSDLNLAVDPPNLYYVLDRSASMSENGKWNTIRTVVSGLMASIGPRAQFAATVFPSPLSSSNNQYACAAGTEVFPLTLGDAPAGTKGPHYQAFLQSMELAPVGGTPTAATLASLIHPLTQLSGKTFVILATDGAPNCNTDETSCNAAACTLNIESDYPCSPTTQSCCDPSVTPGSTGENCIDQDATASSITALKNAGILTYVIGIPGSEAYAAALDQFAEAGGTSRGSEPQYYAATTSDETAIQTTLSTVAAKIVGSCTITLSAAPPDPSLVNVYFDETLVAQDPANGWVINGATVTLEGTSCTQVTTGQVLDVRVIAGCPTALR
jgi:hypothetical protein